MTDAEKFEVVLGELGTLLLKLGDLREHVVVVGGLALEAKARAAGLPEPVTVGADAGVEVVRGYSLDIDLLYSDAGMLDERLPQVLRGCGFERSTSTRWRKTVRGITIPVDLLTHENVDPDALPTPMTAAVGAEPGDGREELEVRAGARLVRIPVPDTVAFLAMKLAARALAPDRYKDSFDVYAYVSIVGPEQVRGALAAAGRRGAEVRETLRARFADERAMGVRDVLSYAGTLAADERELLARAVMDDIAGATA